MARTGGQRGASPTATWQVSPSAHGHHRWMQANDASLHAPHGVLPRDDDGRVCCHLCGRWFVALGAHVKVHSYTADAYRRAMGLLSSRGLVATPLSEQIRRRTRDRYESTAEVRQDLAPGQELARSRQLDRRRHALRSELPEPAQRVRERQQQLAAGRATQEAARRQQLAERLEALGERDLPSYLQTTYRAGASLDTLGRSTGLGRRRLREALIQAGVLIRPTGANTAAGKKARAHAADARVAERLGERAVPLREPRFDQPRGRMGIPRAAPPERGRRAHTSSAVDVTARSRRHTGA